MQYFFNEWSGDVLQLLVAPLTFVEHRFAFEELVLHAVFSFQVLSLKLHLLHIFTFT